MTTSINRHTEQNEDFVYYTYSYSTAEIEDNLFYGESSQRSVAVEIPELEGEYRLIGDELMRIDRKNLPLEKSVLREISEKE